MTALRAFARDHLLTENGDSGHWQNGDYNNHNAGACNLWANIRPQIIKDIVDGVQGFYDIQAWKASRLPTCTVCAGKLQPLVREIENLPTFSSFSTSFN